MVGPVEVRTLAGRSTILSINSSDTCRSVKQQLRAQWDDQHRLFFRVSAISYASELHRYYLQPLCMLEH